MAAAHCEAVIAYLTAFAKAAFPEKAASEKARQFEGLLDSFKQTDLEPGAATELLALLEEQTVFGPDQVQSLAEALADTAPESSRDKPTCKSQKDRRPLQDYSYVFRYCTPDLWTALQDPGLRDFKKLDLLAAHCAKLGLRCPSEFTAQVVTWYFLLYGSDHVPLHDAVAVHQQYLSVKSALQRHGRAAQIATSMLPHVKALPPNPSDLDPAWYSRCFDKAAPAIAPFEDTDLRMNALGVPARGSNSWLRMQQRSASWAPFQGTFPRPSAQTRRPTLLALTDGSSEIPTSSGLRALPCPQASQPLALADSLPAMQPVAQPPAQVHLPSSPAEVAEPARNPKDDSVATTAAANASEVSAGAETAQTSSRRLRLSASNEGNVFSAAQDLQMAMTGKPVASLLQNAESKEQKQPQEEPALPKKVAQLRKKAQPKKVAKSKACAKKPSAKIKKTKLAGPEFKPGSAEEVAHRKTCGVPLALLNKFKKGCATCRERPFCTRSCWRKRGYTV